jgi:hypothetical protein
MSKWIRCENCGQRKEVPAFVGDGVYHPHICPEPDYPEPPHIVLSNPAPDEP